MAKFRAVLGFLPPTLRSSVIFTFELQMRVMIIKVLDCFSAWGEREKSCEPLEGSAEHVVIVSVTIKDTAGVGPQGGFHHKSDAFFGGSGNSEWPEEGRKGRMQAKICLRENRAMQDHVGGGTPGGGFPPSGEEWGRGWVGRGASSSDMPFLPSLQQADPSSPSHAPPDTALRSQTARGTGDMLAAEGQPSRTYRGTGRCSQGRGLCNSGWHRLWPGNRGNLIG